MDHRPAVRYPKFAICFWFGCFAVTLGSVGQWWNVKILSFLTAVAVRKGKKLKRERYWRSLEKLKMSVYCLVTLQQEIQPTCIIKKSNRFFPVREKHGKDNRGRFFSYSTAKNGWAYTYWRKVSNRDRGKNQVEGDPPQSNLCCSWDWQRSRFFILTPDRQHFNFNGFVHFNFQDW